MPTLYLVATPIGNLEDISFRALRILQEVGLIAAEDTRRTKQLLVKYNIKVPITSYHEHNKFTKLDYILSCLNTVDVALVSDAGMPGISDPGHELVVAANRNDIPVVPVPGPSVYERAAGRCFKGRLGGCREMPICGVALIHRHCGVRKSTPHSSGSRAPCI